MPRIILFLVSWYKEFICFLRMPAANRPHLANSVLIENAKDAERISRSLSTLTGDG